MIETFVGGLRANNCTVHGPLDETGALDCIVGLARDRSVACNDDIPIAGLIDALRARDGGVLTPSEAGWHDRIATVALGITGSSLAVAEPAAFALRAGPGAPRATSLLPPAHVCVVPVGALVPTLAEAFDRITELPSALTWVGGPSRTGDLEMIITLGVHGPRTVDVVLLAS